MKGYTVVFWDQVPEADVEAAMKLLVAEEAKAKVREHPMPGYSPDAPPPKTAPPKWTSNPTQGTYTQAHPKTYTPERVLKEMIQEIVDISIWHYPAGYPEKRSKEIVERLKKHGFEITPISVRERAERRAEFGKPLNEY